MSFNRQTGRRKRIVSSSKPIPLNQGKYAIPTHQDLETVKENQRLQDEKNTLADKEKVESLRNEESQLEQNEDYGHAESPSREKHDILESEKRLTQSKVHRDYEKLDRDND